MDQLPIIIGIGSGVPNVPAVATATPFRIEVVTGNGGAALLSLTFEAARDLKNELNIYLKKYPDR
jgi:hypothetical protein